MAFYPRLYDCTSFRCEYLGRVTTKLLWQSHWPYTHCSAFSQSEYCTALRKCVLVLLRRRYPHLNMPGGIAGGNSRSRPWFHFTAGFFQNTAANNSSTVNVVTVTVTGNVQEEVSEPSIKSVLNQDKLFNICSADVAENLNGTLQWITMTFFLPSPRNLQQVTPHSTCRKLYDFTSTSEEFTLKS